MELTQLRYFKILAESGSLSKAAEKLFISPPALSSSINRLEKELGLNLFDRKQTLVLNERGEIFLEYITQALDALDDAQQAMKELNNAHQSRLTIGVASAVVWHNLFLSFLDRYPDICVDQQLVTLQDMSDEHILENYDFILAAPQDLSTEKLHSVTLYDDDYPMLMVSRDHPFATQKGIALIDAKNESFIALSKGNSSRRYFDELFSIAGFSPRIVLECSPNMRRAFVLAGKGIAVVTAQTQLQNAEHGVSFVEITNPYYRRSQCIYWHEKRYQTAAAKAFLSFTVDYYQNGFRGRENSGQL